MRHFHLLFLLISIMILKKDTYLYLLQRLGLPLDSAF